MPSADEGTSGRLRRMTSHGAVAAPCRQTCIRVPSKSDPRRAVYERCGSRASWVHVCLGGDGVYVGRPKNDGGWYLAPTVKAGSLFANPFPLKQYELSESLRRYRALIEARMADGATTAEVITLLPPREQELALRRWGAGSGERVAHGRSVAHLQLGVVGAAFREELLALQGRRLGCFCDEGAECHAGVLAELVAREVAAREASAPPRVVRRDADTSRDVEAAESERPEKRARTE